ncbi:flavodoxin FldA [Buchnera aphidicola]|uniref:flavodoxin FldA n=1 Tax=Buchnera aphidicola TaxID=9 RepID=UPI0030ECB5A9
MKKIGIFYGSDTGNTEKAAKIIQNYLGKENSNVHDINSSETKDILKYKNLILGIPTWYYGELQCDWDDFYLNFKKINFSNKIVAIYGFGDQEDYGEYFCDAMKKIYNIVCKNNGLCVGKWSVKGYSFTESKALLNKNYFIGLTLDEDRQPKKTKQRIKKWLNQICPYFLK